jgi:hypothetical protein
MGRAPEAIITICALSFNSTAGRIDCGAHDPAPSVMRRHNARDNGRDFRALPDLAARIVADAAAGRHVQMNIVQMSLRAGPSRRFF